MRGEYRMLVREQLVCGTHVHIDMDDRDLAMAVARRAAPWLPTLLALSASSPYWLGTDTGYASYRTLIWRRWPTAGPLPGFASASWYFSA
jgi:glutamate---cysteine ligase / carboxylate-amine ligase